MTLTVPLLRALINMHVILRKLKERFASRKVIDLIQQSALFDESFYASFNRGVTGTRADLVQHYVTVGAAAGRDPHPLFSSSFYFDNNPELREAGINPLAHFLNCGAAEGRNPHPLFDIAFYLKNSGPLEGPSSNPLYHYLTAGVDEGLNPHPCFDSIFYLELNPDVAAAGINPLVHYAWLGLREHRSPHPLFDTTFYLAQKPRFDHERQSPLVHYLTHGTRQLLEPSALFDTQYYLRQNPDVADSGINPLLHYLLIGEMEGRKPHPGPSIDLSSKEAEIPPTKDTESTLGHSRSKAITPAPDVEALTTGEKLAPLSVVITTSSRPKLVAETVNECLRHSGGVDLEFIIIDSGVKQDAFQLLRGLVKKHRNVICQHVPNCKPGNARNLGASIAGRSIVLFLNDEVRPLNGDFFTSHSLLHTKHPEAEFAVVGRVSCANGTPAFPANLFELAGTSPRSSLTPLQQSLFRQREAFQCSLSLKKSLVADWVASGFNNDFPITAVEAQEFLYRQTKGNRSFRIYEEPSALVLSAAPNTMQSQITQQIDHGLMLKEFVAIHPEIADFLNLGQLIQILQTPATGGTDLQLTDCMAVMEGIKAWARLLEHEEDFGSQLWHTEVLKAVLVMSLRQGFVLACKQADANFEMAYLSLLKDFMECTRKPLGEASASGHYPLLWQFSPDQEAGANHSPLQLPALTIA